MAVIKDIKKTEYCDEVLTELSFMIETVHELRGLAERAYGKGSEVTRLHDRHLTEIADYLEWKLQILATACPYEWKGLREGVQSEVHVQAFDAVGTPDVSGGYLGG